MATTIKWVDNNSIETAHRIYKSSTYFTKDNLPAPLVELGPDITEYVDSVGVDGENWYIVSALLNDYEVFSEPFIAGLTTAYIHDVFDDGSAVATYNFNGDATDLGGNYNLTSNGVVGYDTGLIQSSLSPLNTTSNYLSTPFTIADIRVVSFWAFSGNKTGVDGFCGSSDSGLSQSVAIFYDSGYFSIEDSEVSRTFYKTADLDMIYANEYNHIVMDWISTTLYVNGEAVTLIDQNVGTTNPSTKSWEIGRAFTEGSLRTTNNRIDQFRIFNRALTQQEVDILYQEGVAYL